MAPAPATINEGYADKLIVSMTKNRDGGPLFVRADHIFMIESDPNTGGSIIQITRKDGSGGHLWAYLSEPPEEVKSIMLEAYNEYRRLAN